MVEISAGFPLPPFSPSPPPFSPSCPPVINGWPPSHIAVDDQVLIGNSGF